MTAEVAAQPVPGQDELLDSAALQLIGELERRFGPRRRALLQAREEREARFAAGERPAFPEETRELRDAEWTVASTPPDLDDRRVEITGPAEAKMVINALNSGASVFMCCLEDALSPTWANVVAGQAAVRDATRRTLEFTSPEGKRYALGDELATLVVRPRGWHLDERHVHVDGRPVSASLFDLALYLRWNGPRVGGARQRALRLPREAREPARGGAVERRVRRRAGGGGPAARDDPRDRPDRDDHRVVRDGGDPVRPARALGRPQRRPLGLHLQRHQEVPRRPEARAPGPRGRDDGRAVHARLHRAARARLPSPRRARDRRHGGVHPEPRRRRQRAGLRARAGGQGARGGSGLRRHLGGAPGLVPLAREIFDAALGDRPNQKARLREDVVPDAAALLSLDRTPGEITLKGVQTNVSVGLRYLDAWLGGVGAAAIDNLMEDAATAEISRAQLWQWIRHGCRTSEGEVDHRRALRARARRRAGAAPGRRASASRPTPGACSTVSCWTRLRAIPDAARRRAAAIAGTPDPVMRRMRAYLRFDRRESRLPAAIAILVVAVLYPLLPVAALAGACVAVPDRRGARRAAADDRRRARAEHPWQRVLALTLLGLTAAANGTSLVLLVRELIARSSDMSGRQLLAGALTVWVANVIVFALWYWELDRGGPRRARPTAAARPTSSSRR